MITQKAEVLYRSEFLGSRTSIIISLYNYESFIEETLDSIQFQTESDIDIIIVNDGSSDNSLNVARNWMESHNNLKMGMLILGHRENSGASIARNTGIAASQSEFCFMLDADNLLYPRCIEKHVAALDARPDAVAAYSLIEVFEGKRDLFGAGVFAEEGLINGNFIDLMALYRRSMLLDFNGFEKIKSGWEDYDLWLRILEAKQTALHIPEITSRYRHHYSSITRTQQKSKNILDLHKEMVRRHPWLKLH